MNRKVLALTFVSVFLVSGAAAQSLPGSGTSSDPYEISDASDWANNVPEYSNVYYELTSDIYFDSSTSLAYYSGSTNPKDVNLYGRGYSLNDFQNNQGLIGLCQQNCGGSQNIQNITFNNFTVINTGMSDSTSLSFFGGDNNGASGLSSIKINNSYLETNGDFDGAAAFLGLGVDGGDKLKLFNSVINSTNADSLLLGDYPEGGSATVIAKNNTLGTAPGIANRGTYIGYATNIDAPNTLNGNGGDYSAFYYNLDNTDSNQGTGLTTAQMTGDSASEYMSNLSFQDTWLETSSYPIFRSEVNVAYNINSYTENSPISTGQNLTVEVNLSEEISGTDSLVLEIDGVVKDSVSVSSGGNYTLEWETSSGDGGNYTARIATSNDERTFDVEVLPPTYNIDSYSTNSPVLEENTFTAEASITEEVAGTDTLELYVGGILRDSQTISSSGNYTLSWSVPDNSVGTYSGSLQTGEDSASFTVDVLDEKYLIENITSNSPITAGDTATVSADFLQERAGTEGVDLSINGTFEDNQDISSGGTYSFNWNTALGEAGTWNATLETDHDQASTLLEVESDPNYQPTSVNSFDPVNETTITFFNDNNPFIDASANVTNGDGDTYVEWLLKTENESTFSVYKDSFVSSSGFVDLSYYYSFNGSAYHDYKVRAYDTDAEGNIISEDTTETRRYYLNQVDLQSIDEYSISPTPSNNVDKSNYEFFYNGTVGENDLDRAELIVYSDGTQVDNITLSKSMIQNGSTFSYNGSIAYDSAYDGTDMSFDLTVYDSEGYTVSDSISGFQADPPTFNFENPADGKLFTTDTDVDVQFDYGGETKEQGSWELLVNGFVEDSTEEVDGTSSEGIHTITYSPPVDNVWEIHFSSTSTGNTYVSDTFREFYVRTSKATVTLDEPLDNAEFDVNFSETKDVTHNFTIDTLGYSGDYIYEFELADSTGSTIDSFTSNSISGDSVENYSVTSTGLEAETYSWTVSAVDAADTSNIYDTKTNSYTISNPDVYSLAINSPSQDQSFEVNSDTNTTDVNASYEVTAETEEVNVTAYLDGSQVDSQTVAAGSGTTSFDLTFQDLEVGTHNFSIQGTDESGRTKQTDVQFEVTEANESFEITKFRLTPNLKEAVSGDELDIYLEGLEGTENVDYFQIQIVQNGSVVKSKIVERGDLNEGSLWYLFQNYLIADEFLGEEVTIRARVVDVAGNIVEDVIKGIVGENEAVAIDVKAPYDGEEFFQDAGNPEDIRFAFDATTNSNTPLNWSIHVANLSTKNYQEAASGTFTQADSTVSVERYRNMVDDLGQNQYGEFIYYVSVYDSLQERYFNSTKRTYSIKETGDQPSINIIDPRDNDIKETPTVNNETAVVQFDYQVKQVSETGTLSLKLINENDDVVEIDRVEDVSTKSLETVEKRIPIGTYDVVASFKSESYNVNESHVFEVRKPEETEPQGSSVSLRSPANEAGLYQGIPQVFSWRVFANESFTSDLIIEDDSGNEVERFTRSKDRTDELMIFRELYDLNISAGSYQFYATLETDSQSLNTSVRNFTVNDFSLPQVQQVSAPANNSVFNATETISFDTTVETFDEQATTTIEVRKIGDVETRTLANKTISQFTTTDLTASQSLEPGNYEWFVRSKINPETTSDSYFFTVEKEDIPEPNITLDTPENDVTFETNTTPLDVDFNFSAQVYSESDAKVELWLQRVGENETYDYETIFTTNMSEADGGLNFNHVEPLNESGYRYKVNITYPNGDEYESNIRTFAVDNVETDDYSPSPPSDTEVVAGGLIEETAKFFGDLNERIKSALGKTGQLFVAIMLILMLAGAAHLLFEVEYLTILATVLLATGFSFADGYLPLEVFWIILAIASGMVAFVGIKAFTGGGS